MAIAEPAEYIPPPEKYADFSGLTGEELSPAVLCNCYNYVKKHKPNLPSTKTILTNLKPNPAPGDVAVFYYPEAGLYHYALVISVDGELKVHETNYTSCTFSQRSLPLQHPSIVGYYTI